jgi:transposase
MSPPITPEQLAALPPEFRALLQSIIQHYEARIAKLEADLAAARKNSSTSSKPPSSDMVKPPSARKQPGRRKRGGQPGHPRHERAAFPPEQVTHTEDYAFDRCPDCGGPVELLDAPARVLQQMEVPAQPVQVTEHRSRVCRCGKCQREFAAPVPEEIQAAGLVGPRLTSLVAYLKGACHCSFSTIRKYLRDTLQVSISRAQLRNLCGKVADSLAGAWQELFASLPEQPRLNIDETGHKENGQALWTWCFRAPLFTLFQISPSRGSEVLVEALGLEFSGIIGCDYFSAYRKYMRLNEHVLVQFCLAHLIRDVKFLVDHPHSRNRAYGQRVLSALRELFAIIHRQDQYPSERAFRIALEDQGYEVWLQATFRTPPTREAQNLAQRFREHGEDYIRFVTTPGVEPTNNLAEQAIRFVVLDRKVTQGTRGVAGRKWCERIWTVLATCTQHGRDVLEFLVESIEAAFAQRAGPSLLPDS